MLFILKILKIAYSEYYMSTIEGEVFKPEIIRKDKISMTDKEINAKYKKGEIRIVTEQARYPIKSIQTMLESGDYKLDPEYQRRKRWDNVRKSRLIESFIMNVPLPPIFLYEYDYSKYEVMDGLQRLTSIFDYYTGQFKLEGLEYWRELEGKKYAELPEEIKKGIDRRYISSIVLLEETAKSEEEAKVLKQIVFERLNSGGEKLTPQETRNALYNGKFNKLCIELSKNDKFREMWNIPLENEGEKALLESDIYREMKDVELVLRFFAYRQLNSLSGSIKKFLDSYLKQANEFSEETLIELTDLFKDTIDVIYEIFGQKAFIQPPYKGAQQKPQKKIYDPLMQSVASKLDNKNQLLEKSEQIKKNKYNLIMNLDDNQRIFRGRNSTRIFVKKRIQYFDHLFEKYIT